MYRYNEFFLVMMLIVCCLILGFVFGWISHWFYIQYCKSIDDECDELECEEDENEDE